MSLVGYLKKKHPKCDIMRPENIYEESKQLHIIPKWREWECVTITRNPIDRIHSGHQYFTVLRQNTIQDVLNGKYHGAVNYQNVGFRDAIKQSNYNYYINKWSRDHGVKVTNYRFEDLIKDPDFPHVNKSGIKVTWSDEDKQHVQDRLNDAGITY